MKNFLKKESYLKKTAPYHIVFFVYYSLIKNMDFYCIEYIVKEENYA